jgi:hypothetical protein
LRRFLFIFIFVYKRGEKLPTFAELRLRRDKPARRGV